MPSFFFLRKCKKKVQLQSRSRYIGFLLFFRIFSSLSAVERADRPVTISQFYRSLSISDLIKIGRAISALCSNDACSPARVAGNVTQGRDFVAVTTDVCTSSFAFFLYLGFNT